MSGKIRVRLRILHGKLQNQRGEGTAMDVAIRRSPFVIGAAADCSMRCKSTSVRPHHCEIEVGLRQARLRVLDEGADTLINDQQVKEQQILRPGDKLRIGRLDFEVLIDLPDGNALSSAPDDFAKDATGDELSDILLEADEKDREFRATHPEVRQLALEPQTGGTQSEAASIEKTGTQSKKGRGKGKKKPGSLPDRPPEDTSQDSTEAAQKALRRMFSR